MPLWVPIPSLREPYYMSLTLWRQFVSQNLTGIAYSSFYADMASDRVVLREEVDLGPLGLLSPNFYRTSNFEFF